MGRTRLMIVLALLALVTLLLVRLALDGGNTTAGGADLVARDLALEGERRFAMPGDEAAVDALAADSAAAAAGAGPGAVPTAAPGDPAALLDLVVFHSDGQPGAGCRVALECGGWVAATWTDAAGRASLVGDDGPGTLWVGGASTTVQRFALPVARGAREVSLAAGAVVEGHVQVEGAASADGVVLAIEEDVAGPGLSEAVTLALKDIGAGFPNHSQNGQRLGADGAFRFSALPRSTELYFVSPPGWSFPDGRAPAVTAPAQGLRLVLRRDPVVRLRILEVDRSPAAGARLGGAVSGPSSTHGLAVTAADDGRAAFPLPAACRPPRVTLSLANAAGSSRLELDLGVLDASRDHDLGDILLQDTWTVPFRVRRPDGTPVPGARLRAERGLDIASEPTGPDGVGELRGVRPDGPDLVAGAPGHAAAFVPLPDGEPQAPLDVVLVPCGRLRLQLLPEGRSFDGLSVEVSYEDPPEAQVDDRLETLRDHGGGDATAVFLMGRETLDERGAPVRRRSVRYLLGSSGRVDLDTGCVPVGRLVWVSASDRLDYVVAEPPPVRLAPGEERVLGLHVDGRAQPVEVLVTDAAGTPLEGIECGISLPASARRDASFIVGAAERTDALGRASCSDVYAPAVELSVSEPGYAPVRRRITPGVLEHVVLDPGHAVVLRCHDPDGRPVAVHASVRRADGSALDREPQALDAGHAAGDPSTAWRFEHLPPERVAFEAQVGGRRFSLEHDAREPEAHLELPASGRLEVSWPELAPFPDGHPVVLARDGEGHELQRLVDFGSRERVGAAALDVVYPGRYEVRLVRMWMGGHQEPLHGPETVEVRAGETARASLR